MELDGADGTGVISDGGATLVDGVSRYKKIFIETCLKTL